MKQLDHPSLVHLIDILENPSEIIIVMELAKRDLFAYIASKRPARLDEEEAKRILLQIAQGMCPPDALTTVVTLAHSGVEYLHSHNFVHRDLKLEVCIPFLVFPFRAHNDCRIFSWVKRAEYSSPILALAPGGTRTPSHRLNADLCYVR